MRERLLREESGFTLAEAMVTIMIMIAVMFALYTVFDMSLRVFSFGNDKTEAVENARLGLERMEREVRAAYPYDKPNGNNTLLTSWTSNSMTFGNDLNGDRKIGSATEQITYGLSGGSPAALQRNGQPVVEFVQDVDGGGALTFTYVDANGASVANEADIRAVRIKLEVAVDRGIQDQPVTQILETDVALRNRGR